MTNNAIRSKIETLLHSPKDPNATGVAAEIIRYANSHLEEVKPAKSDIRRLLTTIKDNFPGLAAKRPRVQYELTACPNCLANFTKRR